MATGSSIVMEKSTKETVTTIRVQSLNSRRPINDASSAANQATQNCKPASRPTGEAAAAVRRRRVTSQSNDVPVRQLSPCRPRPNYRLQAPVTSSPTKTKDNLNTTSVNKTAIFSRSGPSSRCITSPSASCRATPNDIKVNVKNECNRDRASAVGGQLTANLQRSPWRLSDVDSKSKSRPEVHRSVSGEVWRRPRDMTRDTSASARRSLSVHAASSRLDKNEGSPLTPRSPSLGQCSCCGGRSRGTGRVSSKAAESKLPRPILQQRSCTETLMTAENITNDNVLRIEIPIPRVRCLLVWTAALIAVVAICAYLYYSCTRDDTTSQ